MFYTIFNMSKYIKVFLIALVAICYVSQLSAQRRYIDERYIFTQQYVNPVLANPGAAGIGGERQLLFKYRNKWASFDDTPKTVLLSYNGIVSNRLAFGALLMQDTNGALKTSKGQLSFSYNITSPTNEIGFGLSTELIQHSVSAGIFDNPFFDKDDPLALARLDGSQFFDVTFGVYGVYDSKIKYGLSLPGLISSNLDESYEPGIEADGFNYILSLAYVLDLEEEDIVLEPSIFVKQLMFVPNHVDINLKALFLDQKLTGGLSYTVGADERLGFLLGFKVNSLDILYSYNVSRHEFQQYNNGAHEIGVGVNFGSMKLSNQ